jgi:hypothetical protein
MRAAALLLTTALPACIALDSFSQYDVSAYGAPQIVTGTIDGLDDGSTATVRLTVRGQTQSLAVANGEFAFPTGVATGESFQVDVQPPPAFACPLEGAFGIVSSTTHVTVRCASDDASLTSLTASLGPLQSQKGTGFDPDVTDYVLDPVTLLVGSTIRSAVAVAAKARRADAKVSVFGVDGMGKVSASGGFDPSTIAVDVTAKSGTKRTYRVAMRFGHRVKDQPEEAYAQLGNAIAIYGSTIVVGARFRGSDSTGGVDVYDKSSGRPVFVTHLVAADATPTHDFGSSVALEGDRLVVGAASNDHPGSVYVFERQSGVWTQVAKLLAGVPMVSRSFGSRVSLSGDTLVVGDRRDDSSASGIGGNEGATGTTDAGAVHVFRRGSNGVWAREAYIKASNNHANYNFGQSVVLRNDTLFVGAHRDCGDANGVDDSLFFWSGAVHVFQRTGSTWSEVQYLKADNAASVATFGSALAFDGTTLAVGSDGESSGTTGVGATPTGKASGSGAVYLFQKSGGKWAPTLFIKPSDTHAGAAFGSSLALADGFLFVGAQFDPGLGVGLNPTTSKVAASGGNGAAYLFSFATGAWKQVAHFKPPAADGERFRALQVAIGAGAFLIGAPYDPSTTDDPLASSAEQSGGFWMY